jgi:uncharacterized protein with HEPN domain
MSKREPKLLIRDMLESCNKILQYTEKMDFEAFCNDSKTLDAVIRNFEIIGEAANRLPEDFKDEHINIDWHRIRGFRNSIVDDYIGIDFGIVWEIRNNYLRKIIDMLNTL